MTVSLSGIGVDVVVLDVEGTTTPIGFVYDTLFPYARKQLRAYVHRQLAAHTMDGIVAQLRTEWEADAARHTPGLAPAIWLDPVAAGQVEAEVVAYAEFLMDVDRKSPGLKAMQGEIWHQGYHAGDLRGEIFPDVAPALARWTAGGTTVAIYSSGSVLAQELLFRTAPEGDLTRFITRHFDTGIGAKTDAESYRRLAAALGVPTERVAFVSDVATELTAAEATGMRPMLAVRPGNRPQPAHAGWPRISSFDDVVV